MCRRRAAAQWGARAASLDPAFPPGACLLSRDTETALGQHPVSGFIISTTQNHILPVWDVLTKNTCPCCKFSTLLPATLLFMQNRIFLCFLKRGFMFLAFCFAQNRKSCQTCGSCVVGSSQKNCLIPRNGCPVFKRFSSSQLFSSRDWTQGRKRHFRSLAFFRNRESICGIQFLCQCLAVVPRFVLK